jgi:histidine triad (HIT) family protein
MNCIFCKIVNGDIPSYTLYEDDIVKVFLDVNPKANGHILIIPKKHYIDILDMNEDVLKYIYKNISIKMYKLLQIKLNASGLSIRQNNGSLQDVKHYHVHLIPKYEHTEKILDVKEVFDKLNK